jgi:AAA domain, putative AbiEii toxin, Type IV TA system/AAA ATPase domain
MRVTSIQLQNFRSFVDTGVIALAGINVLIGANNAGKSTILRGLQQLQQGIGEPYADVRVGAGEARVDIGLDLDAPFIWKTPSIGSIAIGQSFSFVSKLTSTDRRSGSIAQEIRNPAVNWAQADLRLLATEPDHFVVPYLSKRKAVGYQQDIREQYVLSITSDVSNLAAKLSRLGNPSFPAHEKYVHACKAILGFVVTAIPSEQGQRPGIYITHEQTLPIDQLGEGVPNIVQFLANLAVSDGKLFLIEEPENDIHPQALKALMDLIIESSAKNQFVISTHSNIVVRHLCAVQDSLLYQIRVKNNSLPIESEITRVPDTTDARLVVLSELGYSLSDFELWDGWLVLEESSAERIIRDYLVPWFAPLLSRVRTISSNGVSKVDSTFEDLNRLFLFTHLTPTYRESSWVLVDGDDVGKEAITKLKLKFPTHSPDRFQALSKTAFEEYYPINFSAQVTEVLGIKDKNARRKAKKQLLNAVMAWLDADKERGISALKESACEVIDILLKIQGVLKASSS